ncbi:MAG TPA: iron ABC transporter permease [Steroidobacteraceae bacterium]|nr:iron ABC transporter permease [Steroidobacteraceae bacterium]
MKRHTRLVLVLSLLLLLLAALSLVTGRGGQWLALPSDEAEARLLRLILWELRLPRLVLALLVGAALGLSGAVLQGLTRNPLAEPGLLGVSSGAALGAVIAIYTGLGFAWSLSIPLLGLAGAFGATALTLALGGGGGVLVLILAGAAVSALMLAGTALVLNLAPNPYAAYEITQWMMGSLTDRSWHEVLLAAPFVVAGVVLLLSTGRALDALGLGELQAASLGVDLARLRRRVLLGTALAVGAATAVTGAIGFIGLLAPHLVRARVGHEPGRVLWPAALCGALLLLASDLATRVLPVQPELKLGVLTALVGAPFFLWLVWRMKRVAP